jgi:hypothetical protein
VTLRFLSLHFSYTLICRYSESRDQYYVAYDAGGKEYERFEFLEFSDAKMPAPASTKQLRRSARVSRKTVEYSDDEDDYEEEEDEPTTRTRSTRARNGDKGMH